MKLKALQVQAGNGMVRRRLVPTKEPCWMISRGYRFSNIIYCIRKRIFRPRCGEGRNRRAGTWGWALRRVELESTPSLLRCRGGLRARIPPGSRLRSTRGNSPSGAGNPASDAHHIQTKRLPLTRPPESLVRPRRPRWLRAQRCLHLHRTTDRKPSQTNRRPANQVHKAG